MSKARPSFVPVLGLALLMWTGCGSAEPVPETEAPETPAQSPVDEASEDLLDFEWNLEAFGKLGEEDPILPDTTITLAFEPDGRLSGTAGCNRYMTTFRTGPEGEIEIRALATTKMECPAETMHQERAYLGAFSEVTSFDVGGGRLQLFYGEAEYAMLFRGEPRDESDAGTD